MTATATNVLEMEASINGVVALTGISCSRSAYPYPLHQNISSLLMIQADRPGTRAIDISSTIMASNSGNSG